MMHLGTSVRWVIYGLHAFLQSFDLAGAQDEQRTGTGWVIVQMRPSASSVQDCPRALAVAGQITKADFGLDWSRAEKAFSGVTISGSLLEDSKRFRERYEQIKARLLTQGRVLAPNSAFVDLSPFYRVPCALGKEEAAAHFLRHDPRVVAAAPESVAKVFGLPNDPFVDPDQNGTWSVGAWGQGFEDLWGIKRVGADQAWAAGFFGAGVVVGVVDSGIDYNHSDIAANIFINASEKSGVTGVDDDGNGFVDDVYGYDFATYGGKSPDANPIDDLGHGTHVAGIIAAPINGIGVVGVAPKARVLAVKALTSEGFGLESDLAKAVQYAVDQGADIINSSWGGEGYSLLYGAAFAYADSLGVLCVAAAGNSSKDVAGFAPANLPTVIAISSSSPDGSLSAFSNFGEKIELAGPGSGNGPASQSNPAIQGVLSLRAAGTNLLAGSGWPNPSQYLVPANTSSAQYIRAAGTSMACPHVAGVAAIAKEMIPILNNHQLRAFLDATAMDLGEDDVDPSFGFGLVSVAGLFHPPDCNANGFPDWAEAYYGVVSDCNDNLIPDACEWVDCNGNGALDVCDIEGGVSADCNGNGVPDECDIAAGTSADCNGNGLPDECESFAQQKLFAAAGEPGAFFGSQVSVCGDWLAVGAIGDDEKGSFAGAVLLFHRDSDGAWNQTAKLHPSDAEAYKFFGEKLVLRGDLLIVGVSHDSQKGPSAGAAYLFRRQPDGVWNQESKIFASDATAGDFFGIAVDADGDTVVVGSFLDDDHGSNSGSAYVFERNTSGSWVQKAKLSASDGGASDFFGETVAVRGDWIVAGANENDDQGSNSGAAYVFQRNSSGNWTQAGKLLPADGSAGDLFGTAVAMDGETIAIGASGDTDQGVAAGSIYVFRRQAGGIWTQEAKLLSGDGPVASGFGVSLAVNDEAILAGNDFDDIQGVDSGSVVVFRRQPNGSWQKKAKLFAFEGAAHALLGQTVSFQGDTMVAGAASDGALGLYSGSVSVFTLGDQDGNGVFDGCQLFIDLGFAEPGVSGSPKLEGTWNLANGFMSLRLSGAKASAASFLAIGTTAGYQPQWGGVLVPSLNPGTISAVLLAPTNASGQFHLGGFFPLGLALSGTEFFVQDWIVDPAGPKGFAVSNALKLTVP